MSAGQTYFDDLKLPEQSLYKGVEDIIIARAKGGDGMPRMDTIVYANAVVDEMEKGKSGQFWYGEFAEMVRQSRTNVNVPLEAMVRVHSILQFFELETRTHRKTGLCNKPGNWTRHLEALESGLCPDCFIYSFFFEKLVLV